MREVTTSKKEEAPPPPLVDATEAASEEVEAPSSKKSAAPAPSKVLAEMHANEDRNLKDWLEEIAPGGAIRVKVVRNSPKTWKGLNVGGSLATYDQQIDEEWIRDHHGGGDFMLTVQKPRSNGTGWVYAGGRVVKIAGDPRTDDVYRDKADQNPTVANPAGGIVDRVVGSLERQLEHAQRQHAPAGPDTETMRLMMGPMQRQLDQMSAMIREKDAQLLAQQNKPEAPRDEFRDKMLDKLLDGDSARITALRTQYESELRQVKQSAMDNESRLRDSFERDKQAISMSHERELNALRSAYDMRVASQETSHSTSRTLMDGEIRRLQADLSEAKAELAALRLKKDKTILEQASEFAAIKEAIGDITGDDEKPKSGWEKFAEVASSLPVVQSTLSKLTDQQQAPEPPPMPQLRQPRLMTGPDGNLYREGPNGRPVLVRTRRPPPTAPGEIPLPDIAPTTIKVAVDFLESAFRGGQEADQVATSVRSMIPGEVLAAIRAHGVDGFLTDVAKIEGTSPLASQAGRNWTRKLGKALLGE